MAKKITVVGPCEEILKDINVTSNPTSSPTTNGETAGGAGAHKRTYSPDAVPEVTRDTNVGKQAKENVGGSSAS